MSDLPTTTASKSANPLRVTVLGPTGLGGSAIAVELLNRGHYVTGMSRNPEKLGKHENYKTKKVDLSTVGMDELTALLKDTDVVIDAYGPHTGGPKALEYQPFIELTRKVVLSARFAKVPYFIMIGGCGSLYVPGLGDGHTTAVDYPEFWRAFSNLMADSEAMLHYMEHALGHMGTELRKLGAARKSRAEGKATQAELDTIATYEKMTMEGDEGLSFVRAARASFMFFDGVTSFKWSYASPPPGYRPGRRTGKYETSLDVLPLDPVGADIKDLDGKMLGITTSDMAVAVVDEAERKSKTWQHWTAVGSVDPDVPFPTYARLQ